MQEKAIVKLNADGSLASCAKGVDASECGFKAGDKACGKCGAMAVMAKGDMGDMDLEDAADEEDEMGEEEMPMKNSRKAAAPMMDDEEEEQMFPIKKKKPMAMDEEEADMPMDEEEAKMSMDPAEEETQAMQNMRKKMRMRRLNSMGFKSADMETDEVFMCQFERKVYPMGESVCDSCPGGCMPEGKMPGILEIEGIAEDMFSGKVLDSGYSDDADLFIVDVERKDGKPIEIFFDGETAEVMGWHMLNADVLNVKSGLQNQSLISFSEAAEIATKSVFGDVVAVEPDVFEGFDAYAVEIEGLDGKSYDVFVSLDGELLGYDEYTLDEAESIEAEAAEIALKRAYNEESRDQMAKSGSAMSDGSYPIKDESDLRNAVQAYGRAKDKEAAKAHIMKRALDLGLEELIPTNWVPAEDKNKAKMEGKSEEESFLNDLLEFEMLTAEQGIEGEK